MNTMNIRQFELARGPRGHNIKALRDLFMSHDVPEEDALQMGIRVVDLHHPILNSTPSAFLYEWALDQLSFYKELHL